MRRGKKYKQTEEAIDARQLYGWEEGVGILKSTPQRAFDETVELSFHLGIDGRQADQALRGTVMLPHGTGKDVRILVLTQGDLEKEAQEAGADYVGGGDLVEKNPGWVARIRYGHCLARYDGTGR